MIGNSIVLRNVLDMVRKVAKVRATVLITGETGTGKELVAQAIHNQGPWSSSPFVAVNCGALSDTLNDSQMFGHRRGSFTGAERDHDGYFRAADGGTLFLDEVSETPLALQVKLLRVIQEQKVTPLGSSHPVKVDVRIIAATNKDLAAEVKAGRFREDLYYRLSIVPIEVPPLRERAGDIPLLISHFLAQHAHKNNTRIQLEKDAFARLCTYPWPGNVRELENTLERLVVMSDDGTILAEDLPAAAKCHPSNGDLRDGVNLPYEGIDLDRFLSSIENNLMLQALERAGGSKTLAGQLLGLQRTTLLMRLKQKGLHVAPKQAVANLVAIRQLKERWAEQVA